jgi:hypothetical protein
VRADIAEIVYTHVKRFFFKALVMPDAMPDTTPDAAGNDIGGKSGGIECMQ